MLLNLLIKLTQLSQSTVNLSLLILMSSSTKGKKREKRRANSLKTVCRLFCKHLKVLVLNWRWIRKRNSPPSKNNFKLYTTLVWWDERNIKWRGNTIKPCTSSMELHFNFDAGQKNVTQTLLWCVILFRIFPEQLRWQNHKRKPSWYNRIKSLGLNCVKSYEKHSRHFSLSLSLSRHSLLPYIPITYLD